MVGSIFESVLSREKNAMEKTTESVDAQDCLRGDGQRGQPRHMFIKTL